MSYTCLVTLFNALFIPDTQEDEPTHKVQKPSSSPAPGTSGLLTQCNANYYL